MSAGVYLITNLVTNERYVGYSINLKKRERDYKGNRIRTQPLIHESITKHGYSNHEFRILFDFGDISPTTNQLKQLESVFIRYYKYWIKSSMLNTNEGGGGSGKWSAEKKKEKSLNRRGRWSKSVLQYGLDGKFIRKWDRISEVSRELNIDYNYLIRCLKANDKSRSAGGYQWRYDATGVEKKLGQYDMEGNLLKLWINAAEFLRETGRSIKCVTIIYDACNGKRRVKSAYGFKWKYVSIVKLNVEYGDIEPYEKLISTKPILQYSLEGDFIKEWNSALDAVRMLDIGKEEIYNSLNGVVNKRFVRRPDKFQWRHKTSENFSKKISAVSLPVILQYDLDGVFVKAWTLSAKDIGEKLNISRKGIIACLTGIQKTYNNSQWRRGRSDSYSTESIPSLLKYKPVEVTTPVKLLQYSMDGKFIKAWDYPAIATKELGVASGSITANIKGRLKSAGKFRWLYGDVNNIVELPPLRVVHQFSMDGQFIREWNTASDITKKLGYRQGNISACLTGAAHSNGFLWKYK